MKAGTDGSTALTTIENPWGSRITTCLDSVPMHRQDDAVSDISLLGIPSMHVIVVLCTSGWMGVTRVSDPVESKTVQHKAHLRSKQGGKSRTLITAQLLKRPNALWPYCSLPVWAASSPFLYFLTGSLSSHPRPRMQEGHPSSTSHASLHHGECSNDPSRHSLEWTRCACYSRSETEPKER